MSWFRTGRKENDTKDRIVRFEQAQKRENIKSGESHKTLFGKIAKYFADLKTVAFTGSYNDLSNKPTNMDTVDNFHASQTAGAKNSCVVTDANGYINANYINSNTNANENPTIGSFVVTNNTNDGYYRKAALEHVRNSLFNGATRLNGHIYINAIHVGNGNERDEDNNRVTIGHNYLKFYNKCDSLIVQTGIDTRKVSYHFYITGDYGATGGEGATFGGCFAPHRLWSDGLGGAYQGCALGDTSNRWTNFYVRQIYSSNNVSVTSDKNKKKDFMEITEAFANAIIDGLIPTSFLYKDGTSGRRHYGLIAQDVENLLKKLGIDNKDFAPLIKDYPIKNKEDEGIEVVVIDYDADPEYGLRYDGFIGIIIKYIQGLKSQISNLESKYNALEVRVKNLEDKLGGIIL